jgi:Bacterial PH domain
MPAEEALEKNVGTDVASLVSPEINTFEQRGNLRLFREALLPGERLVVVARSQVGGSRRRGIVGLTNHRMLFVMERVIKRPVKISIPLREIVDFEVRGGNSGGELRVITSNTTYEFSLITPASRAWAIYGHLGLQLDELRPGNT